VQSVVGLQDVLAGVVKVTVAEQEAEASVAEVVLVVALDGVRDEGEAESVVRAGEGVTGKVATDDYGLVILRVCERLMLAFVPADACEDA